MLCGGEQLVKAKFSEGASGAFFAYSHDNKYVIKTLQVRVCVRVCV